LNSNSKNNKLHFNIANIVYKNFCLVGKGSTEKKCMYSKSNLSQFLL